MRNLDEIFFIKIFSYLLAAGFFMILIVVTTFDINDAVSFDTGEIMPEVPQNDYKAPFDAIPKTICVTEGQKVKTGDTLMILENEQVHTDYEVAQSNYKAALKSNNAVSELISITNKKIQKLKRQRKINSKVFESQKKDLTDNLEYTDEKTELNRKKLKNVGLAKLKMDSTLFKNQIISKLEINNSYDNYLNYRNSVLESENDRNQIKAKINNLENDYLKSENQLDLQLIEANQKLEELKIEKSTSDKELKTTSENLKFSRETSQKQFIIADLDGIVMNLFNLKYSQNFVNKDELLISVVPSKDNFYARVLIPQRDVRYIKAGQEAHLKFDAFDVYQNGILKGTVSYVPDAPDRKQQENFYVILKLSSNPNFKLKTGYSVKGEIIIHRLKLYQFIAKKLFRKFENSPKAVQTKSTSAD